MNGYDILGMIFLIIIIIALIIYILKVIGEWKMFTKAGNEGWPALIPIYNDYILCKLVGVNPWWIVISLVIGFVPLVGVIFSPFVTFYFYGILYISTSRSYGKSDVFALGLFFLTPIFMLILGFDDSKYLGKKPVSDPIFDSLGINKKEEKVKEAEVVKEEKVEKENTCPECGKSVTKDAKFCKNCGKEL